MTNAPLTDLELAQLLVHAAGSAALPFFRADVTHRFKDGPSDPVTEADEAAQACMIALLDEHRPQDGILAEEHDFQRPSQSGRRWLLDPIDGTLPFLRGLPTWCTVAAVQEESKGDTLAAAVMDPFAQETWSCSDSEATRLNGHQVHTAPTTLLQNAFVRVWLDRRTTVNPLYQQALLSLATQSASMAAACAAGIAHAWVAGGRLDASVDLQDGKAGGIWDWEPGAELVRRAGGVTAEHGLWLVSAATPELLQEILTVLPA